MNLRQLVLEYRFMREHVRSPVWIAIFMTAAVILEAVEERS